MTKLGYNMLKRYAKLAIIYTQLTDNVFLNTYRVNFVYKIAKIVVLRPP